MFALCVVIAVTGVVAYLSGDEHFLGGANIAISILTMLILPVLQATQNRDGAALQAKIDELIKVNGEARDQLNGLEKRDEKEIERVRACEGG